MLVKEIGEPTVQYPSVSGEVCTHVLEASQTGFGVDIGLQELSQPIVPQPTFELSAGSHISDPFFIPSPQEGDFVALQEAVVPLLEPAHDHDHGPLPFTVDATHSRKTFSIIRATNPIDRIRCKSRTGIITHTWFSIVCAIIT